MLLTQLQSLGQRPDWLRDDGYSDQTYREGIQAWQQASKDAFRDEFLLLAAGRHLAAALRQRPDHAGLCAALAFLTLLRSEISQARFYLRKALRHDPAHRSALELLPLLEKQAILQSARAPRHGRQRVLSEHSAADDDALYEASQALVAHALQLTAKLPPQPAPVVEDADFHTLARQKTDLEELGQRIQTQLDSIEGEFDTSELRARVVPLERLIRHYRRAIELSQSFRALAAEIGRLRLRTRLLIQHFQTLKESDLLIFYGILDSCEAIADKLDVLDTQGIDINPVESLYLQLIGYVGHLQDLFDES